MIFFVFIKAYGDVISEMNSKTSFETRRIHHEDPEIHTIVPSADSKRVVLLSSKARGSDWDLSTTVKDEQDSNGIESEDSGFQVDVDSSKITEVVAPTNTMTVTTKKVLFKIKGRCNHLYLLSTTKTEWNDCD